MPSIKRDQTLPARVHEATTYKLVPGARNISRSGSNRASWWPTIQRFDGRPDAIALATREVGVYLLRYLDFLERRGQLRLFGPSDSNNTSPATKEARTTQQIRPISEDEESRFPEGAELYRLHRQRERDATLAVRAKQKRLSQVGYLSCDVCEFDFEKAYGDLGAGFIEMHHTIPVSQLTGNARTRITDLALVCSNCHRMLHRGPRLLSIDELRLLRTQRGVNYHVH